jgi:hypothetical protein
MVRILLAAIVLAAASGGALAQGINRNPVALQHDPNDPRYKAHSSGGRTSVFGARYAAQAQSGQPWQITRDCASACTMGFGHFPKNKICIARNVKLGFHEGSNHRATADMWSSYPAEIRSLINARGGMKPEWLWIPAREFHRLGYAPC